jgi:hypothetical protein
MPVPMVPVAFKVFPLHDSPVPAVIRADGVSKNVFQFVDDAVRGILNQSAAVNNPRFEAEALGRLKVTVPVLVAILKSDPVVPVANVNVGPAAPLIVVVENMALNVFPDQDRFDPAMIRADGVSKKVFQLVEEAVRGML